MTQIAEDLRASEPEGALDPALRAKILGIAPNPNDAVGAPLAAPSSLPARSGARGRNRFVLGWTLAGAALVAWLLLFPLFQTVRENSRRISPVGAASAPQAAEVPTSVAALRNIRPFAAGASAPTRHAGGGGYPSSADALVTPQSPSLANPDLLQRQVHKEATIGVQVANPEAASDRVETLVKEAGGFVAANTLNTVGDGLKSADMTVKVPVAQFETVLGQIAKLGSVQSKNVTGEDITEKASDADQTESVLEGDVQSSEARLKALSTKAKWSDQQATRDLRTQLAEARARLVLLKRMAALSTVTIDLSQTPKPPAPAPVTGGFLNGLKASTHDALGSLVSSAGALIALAIWLLAYAPLWIPALIVGRYGLREYRKRQVANL